MAVVGDEDAPVFFIILFLHFVLHFLQVQGESAKFVLSLNLKTNTYEKIITCKGDLFGSFQKFRPHSLGKIF